MLEGGAELTSASRCSRAIRSIMSGVASMPMCSVHERTLPTQRSIVSIGRLRNSEARWRLTGSLLTRAAKASIAVSFLWKPRGKPPGTGSRGYFAYSFHRFRGECQPSLRAVFASWGGLSCEAVAMRAQLAPRTGTDRFRAGGSRAGRSGAGSPPGGFEDARGPGGQGARGAGGQGARRPGGQDTVVRVDTDGPDPAHAAGPEAERAVPAE